MLQEFKAVNHLDQNGNPAGGNVDCIGLTIMWQSGPLGRGDGRKMPNGAFVETVIQAALQRIEHYQTTKFKSVENAKALASLESAMLYLHKRTQDREKREVEGTHKL